MDIDAFVDAHSPTWARLEELAKRSGRLRGAELDELVELYQRATTHLSVVLTHSPDPQLVASLTALVARARAAVTGRRTVSWRVVPEFLLRTLPAAAWRARRWWLGVAAVTLLIALVATEWIATHPDIRERLLSASDRASLETQFRTYYSDHPHSSFAAEVWTHNATIAAESLAFGLLLGLPTLYFVVATGFQLAVPAGYLIAGGRTGEFFAYILPHGMLELTAVFLAMGAGLRLGWTVVDPGPRTRSAALAEEGRTTFALALGCALMLLCSGLIEGFVTPSTVLAPWIKVLIGALAEAVFLTYLLVLGRRAAAAGLTGDVAVDLRGDVVPVAG